MDNMALSGEDFLLKVEEVAKMLRLSRAKTYALVAEGVIPSIRIGHAVRIPRAQFRRWLQGLTIANQALD